MIDETTSLTTFIHEEEDEVFERNTATLPSKWLIFEKTFLAMCGLTLVILVSFFIYSISSNVENTNIKKYVIAVGGDFRPQETLLSNGSLVGFHIELVSEVCRESEIICETVFEPYTNCWDTIAGEQPRGGIGLLGNWYDVCAGWARTVERDRVFGFTDPFTIPRISYFYRFNSSESLEDGADSYKYMDIVGLLDGWSSDEHCLKRNGIDIPDEGLDDNKYSYELFEKFKADEIDSVFLVEGVLNSSFVKILPGYQCDLSGSSMMTLKSSDFVEKWNFGFLKVLKNGIYDELCEKWDFTKYCIKTN